MDGTDQLGASHDPAVTLLVCPASLPEAASVPCCNKFSFMRICNNDEYVIFRAQGEVIKVMECI